MASFINVSYTPKMHKYFDLVEVMQAKLQDKLHEMEKLDVIIQASRERVKKAEDDFNLAALNYNVDLNKMAEVQDQYNEIAIQLEDYINELENEEFKVNPHDYVDSDEYESDDADLEEEYRVVTVTPRLRMTRKNVLTPEEAVKANKASKMHKLKPRSKKRDLTKTKEDKNNSKRVKKSHNTTH